MISRIHPSRLLCLFILIATFAISSIDRKFTVFTSAHAKTISAQRIAASLRFIPLEKLTVGPDDQYHGIVDPTGEDLVFTRKTDLVSHLCRQNLKTGEVTDLLSLSADSQEPSFSQDGKVAFTYFQFHATGDICYQTYSKVANAASKMTCLKIEKGEPSSPFWKSSTELGYLLKDSWTQNSKIVIENIQTGAKRIVAEGKLWSPAMQPGGRYLVYNEMIHHRVLVLKDLQTGTAQTLHFNLPGISGFPAISEDEKYLYFSHYLNDTNNDNIIDGNDNSVIFRVPLQTALTQDLIFPEQLTSVESNCSFPRPYKDVIYATCALDSALDIYRIPATGIVPSHWNEAVLNNAHQTSRSYADRILVLNTLKYRFPRKSTVSLEERILSDHIMADDLASSKYYLAHLKSVATPGQKDFYSLLNFYLEAREKKKLQKSNEVTPTFEVEIGEAQRKIDAVATHPRFKLILKGLFQRFLNRPEKSASYLKMIHFDTFPRSSVRSSAQPLPQRPAHLLSHPLERYFYFELANWALPKLKQFENLNETYHQMMSASEFSEESQIYYAFHFLNSLQTRAHFDLAQRIQSIQNIEKNLPSHVRSLLQSEIITLKLVQASTEKEKALAYQQLDKLMSASRSNYFLRKALSIRCILNFAESGEFKYLNFVATNWLRYTQSDDTEFAYAREVYAFANLDRAYDTLGKKDLDLARNYFFGSLTLTDDLESHYGYVRILMLQNQQTTLNERYKNLKDHQQIEDNIKFVEALMILMNAHPSSRTDVRHLDLALEKLQAMEQDRDSAVRYLLMGYCSLEKLLRLGSGYEIDRELFDNAHRELMLSYDQGLDNPRIQASALMNLGILHQRAQNHGLAVKFFTKRKLLGFTSDIETTQFSWLYARSLYYIRLPDQASAEIKKALGETSLEGKNTSSSKNQNISPSFPDSYKTPLQERLGFYLHSAGKFSEAVQVYEKLLKKDLKDHKITSSMNLAKVYLGYGYSLFKLQRENEAKIALEKALQYVKNLEEIPRGQDRWIDFQPARIELIIYGFLSQMGSSKDRLDASEKRHSLLLKSKPLLSEWLSTVIQNELQVAYLFNSRDDFGTHSKINLKDRAKTKQQSHQKDPARAAVWIQEALKHAEELGDSNTYLSQSIYQAAIAFLVQAHLNPQIYKPLNSKRIQKIVEKILQAYSRQQVPQPILETQKLKLQNLWTAYTSTQVEK